MPGFDGTGPRGMGPMTGGRRGRCVPAAESNVPIAETAAPQAATQVAPPGYGLGGRSGRTTGRGAGRCGGHSHLGGRGRW